MTEAAPHRRLCTDCGISRTDAPQRCATACQFIHPDYPSLEQKVHGRQRARQNDELYFGPHQNLYSARLKKPLEGAQWTGITTRLAERLLENNEVDAVIAMAPDPNDRWRPMPIVVTRAEDMKQCRGMRMGYAPLLSLVEPALAQGDVVLCDRFTDATFAYQGGGRGFDLNVLKQLEQWVQAQPDHTLRQPDLTFWFALDPAIAAERLAGARVPDRFESQPVAFFKQVHQGYEDRAQAQPQRFARLDAAQTRHAVWQQITRVLVARGWMSIMVPVPAALSGTAP